MVAFDNYDEEKTVRPREKTRANELEISNLSTHLVEQKMTEKELLTAFGKEGWYQTEDEIYHRYCSTPIKVEIEEHQ